MAFIVTLKAFHLFNHQPLTNQRFPAITNWCAAAPFPPSMSQKFDHLNILLPIVADYSLCLVCYYEELILVAKAHDR
jgi:hypothetical protein